MLFVDDTDAEDALRNALDVLQGEEQGVEGAGDNVEGAVQYLRDQSLKIHLEMSQPVPKPHA